MEFSSAEGFSRLFRVLLRSIKRNDLHIVLQKLERKRLAANGNAALQNRACRCVLYLSVYRASEASSAAWRQAARFIS
jgi:hypothetical protein